MLPSEDAGPRRGLLESYPLKLIGSLRKYLVWCLVALLSRQ